MSRTKDTNCFTKDRFVFLTVLLTSMSNIDIDMRQRTHILVFWSRSFDTECTPGT